MKTFVKWILVGLAFALGVMAAEHCDAYTIRSVRSLNAPVSSGPGVGFTTQANPFYVPGGGLYWRVLISMPGNSRLTWQIEGQMSDGTWIIIAGPILNFSGTTNSNYSFSFPGPWQDMRVNLVSKGAGSITADIYVTY